MANKIGTFDPRIGDINDDFVVARAAELFEAGRPAAERADSAVDASSVIAQGWLAEVAAERGVRADSLAGGLARRLPPRRADAAYYNSGDDLSAPLRPEPFVKQQKPRALLSGFPVENIGAGQMRFYANFLDHVGGASIYTPGTNVIATADIDRSQDEARDVFTYVVQVPEDWLLSRMDQFAGRDNTSQRQAAGALALEKAFNQAILNGAPGYNALSLAGASQVGTLRIDSTATYGTDAADDVFEDLHVACQAISEESEGAFDSPDTLMVTRRIMHRLARYQNFDVGGPSDANRIVQGILSSYGISQVIMADELRDFEGSANRDAMVFFNRSGDETRLRQVVSMRPTPIKSVETLTGRVTLMAGRHAGLYLPQSGSALIYTVGVSA